MRRSCGRWGIPWLTCSASYAREDLPFIRRLSAALQARNREVWVDLEDIIPSARWMEEIRTAITEADAVAFVITPDPVTSEVCRIELDYATEASKRLVPIIARETPTDGVPAALAELNWLSFLDGTDFEAGVNRLVEVLDTDIDRVHPHTRLLTQARKWETRSHDSGLLLRGAELKEAETWLADQAGRHTRPSPADPGQPPRHHPPPARHRDHRGGGGGRLGGADHLRGHPAPDRRPPAPNRYRP